MSMLTRNDVAQSVVPVKCCSECCSVVETEKHKLRLGYGTRAQYAGPRHEPGASDLRKEECAEAAVLLQATLAALTRTVEPDDKGALATEGFLAIRCSILESTLKRRLLTEICSVSGDAFSVETTARHSLRPPTWWSRSYSKESTPRL